MQYKSGLTSSAAVLFNGKTTCNRKIRACEDNLDSWQAGCIQCDGLTVEQGKDMDKQKSQLEQRELDPLVYDGTSAGTVVVSFCFGDTQGGMEADAESLSLICRSLTGRTAPAGRRWPGTHSAERQDFSVASWISPSSLSDKPTEPCCSAS